MFNLVIFCKKRVDSPADVHLTAADISAVAYKICLYRKRSNKKAAYTAIKHCPNKPPLPKCFETEMSSDDAINLFHDLIDNYDFKESDD